MDGQNMDNNQNTDAQQNQQGTDNQNQQNQSNGGNNGDQNQQQQQQNSGAKTFTQEDVNAIGAREKNQGKSAILKMFGCADEKTAKAEAEEFRKWKESQKTDEQKRNEAEQQLKDSAAESEKRAVAAENKLTALAAGVTTESLDDALAIALLKVTEDKSLDKVFAEMKKESRYAGFFGAGSSNNGGTGSSADHTKGQGGNKGNIGERLAQGRVASAPAKSNFFTKS